MLAVGWLDSLTACNIYIHFSSYFCTAHTANSNSIIYPSVRLFSGEIQEEFEGARAKKCRGGKTHWLLIASAGEGWKKWVRRRQFPTSSRRKDNNNSRTKQLGQRLQLQQQLALKWSHNSMLIWSGVSRLGAFLLQLDPPIQSHQHPSKKKIRKQEAKLFCPVKYLRYVYVPWRQKRRRGRFPLFQASWSPLLYSTLSLIPQIAISLIINAQDTWWWSIPFFQRKVEAAHNPAQPNDNDDQSCASLL